MIYDRISSDEHNSRLGTLSHGGKNEDTTRSYPVLPIIGRLL